MDKKFYNRKEKMERLNIYFSWLNRDKSQEYIDEHNWERFYYMRKNNKHYRNLTFAPSKNIADRYSHIFKEKTNPEYFEYLDFYDLKYIIKSYKNRTYYKRYIVSGNIYGGVKIGQRYFHENDILNYLKIKSIRELIKNHKL